jgi:ribonuclease HII
VIIGVDEAGRGPLAGPVVAAAVVLCEGGIAGLDDSKKLTATRRAALEVEIKARCRWAVGEASVAEIDALNILQATMLAMTRAVEGLLAPLPLAGGGEQSHVPLFTGGSESAPHCQSHPNPSRKREDLLILVDGNRLPKWCYPARAIIGGDALEPAISAASILAKEYRDRIMVAADAVYPGYGFARHKGYGSAAHRDAIAQLGPCPVHRMSFAPMRQRTLNF